MKLCYLDQEVNQSKTGKPFKKSAPKFVFYPVDTDDSEDLAFSVNLRKIASHYTDNEKIKRILTAKADEHLKTSKDKERKSPESRNLEKTDSRSEEERNKSSALDQFFSRDKVSSMRKNQPVSHGDTFRRKVSITLRNKIKEATFLTNFKNLVQIHSL